MDFLVPDTNGTCARQNERRRKVVLTRKFALVAAILPVTRVRCIGVTAGRCVPQLLWPRCRHLAAWS